MALERLKSDLAHLNTQGAIYIVANLPKVHVYAGRWPVQGSA